MKISVAFNICVESKAWNCDLRFVGHRELPFFPQINDRFYFGCPDESNEINGIVDESRYCIDGGEGVDGEEVLISVRCTVVDLTQEEVVEVMVARNNWTQLGAWEATNAEVTRAIQER